MGTSKKQVNHEVHRNSRNFLVGISFSAKLQTENPGWMEGEVMAGGIAPGNPSEGYGDALLVHEKAHQDRYLSTVCDYSVDKVLKHSTQIVAGTMTRVTFTIKGKGCKKLTCSGKVWSRSWLNKVKVMPGYNCQ